MAGLEHVEDNLYPWCDHGGANLIQRQPCPQSRVVTGPSQHIGPCLTYAWRV